MDIGNAIILGLIQGLTEFIPVSSSGHLVLAAKLLGIEGSNFQFDVAIHGGTLIALIIYFYSDLVKYVTKWKREQKLLIAVFISTLPAALVGYLFKGFVEQHTRSLWLVVVNLAFVGWIMYVSHNWPGKRQIKDMNHSHAFSIGLAQIAALMPGVSRSGITILTGRSLGYSWRAATRYSFLIAIPITAGAFINVVFSSEGLAALQAAPAVMITGLISAAIGGFLAIHLMLKLVSQHSLRPFGLYRMVLAVLISLLLVTNIIS